MNNSIIACTGVNQMTTGLPYSAGENNHTGYSMHGIRGLKMAGCRDLKDRITKQLKLSRIIT